jgi:hypothetical protein
MDTYRSSKNREQFEISFNALMDNRGIPSALDRSMFENDRCCLLCSEQRAVECHRSLVAERLAAIWGDVTVTNLE